jgi:hypothetical protein
MYKRLHTHKHAHTIALLFPRTHHTVLHQSLRTHSTLLLFLSLSTTLLLPHPSIPTWFPCKRLWVKPPPTRRPRMRQRPPPRPRLPLCNHRRDRRPSDSGTLIPWPGFREAPIPGLPPGATGKLICNHNQTRDAGVCICTCANKGRVARGEYRSYQTQGSHMNSRYILVTMQISIGQRIHYQCYVYPAVSDASLFRYI